VRVRLRVVLPDLVYIACWFGSALWASFTTLGGLVPLGITFAILLSDHARQLPAGTAMSIDQLGPDVPLLGYALLVAFLIQVIWTPVRRHRESLRVIAEITSERDQAQEQVARLQTVGTTDCELSDDVLAITRIEPEDWDELTGNLRGMALSFLCVARAPQEVANCRLRHEKLFVQADDNGWNQQKWLKPTDLEWEDDGLTHTFQPGAQRAARLVSIDNWSPTPRPTVRLASGALRRLDYQATYRAFLSAEAGGYRVRQIVVEFGWARPGQQGALRWSKVQDPTLMQFQPSTPRTEEAPRQ
jgi:hypothetical protein